jgi:outer membrane lipase/esterase
LGLKPHLSSATLLEINMKNIKLALSGVAFAALLSACGGSSDNRIKFAQVVTFGDSVSDAGTYQVGDIAALGGGKFTVNGVANNIWTEALASNLGAGTQCAAQTGLLANNGVKGAAVVNNAQCNNYAQGSSRVTAVGSGPNGVALQKAPFNQVNLGLIADSIQNQINRHLAKVGAFGATDVVTVNGGGNDFFMQLGAVGAAATGGAAAQGAASIAGWPAATIGTVGAGGQAAVDAAGPAAVTAMGQAGAELAVYVKTLIVAKGAKYVVVRNLGDLNGTPFGSTFGAGTKQLSTAMTTTFNSSLKQGLAGVEGVIYFDDYARGQAISANPSASGYSNITGFACGRDAFSQPGDVIGNSIICNAKTLVAGDTSKYAFSDSVHPTPFAAQDAAAFTVNLMRTAGIDF